MERGGRRKKIQKKRAFDRSKNLETWKPEPGAVHVRRAQLIHPTTTRVERGNCRGRGKEKPVALLQRETGGIKQEIEKKKRRGVGGGGVDFRLLLISGFVLRSEAPAALAAPRETRRLFFRVVG